jgi:hypothetical protein
MCGSGANECSSERNGAPAAAAAGPDDENRDGSGGNELVLLERVEPESGPVPILCGEWIGPDAGRVAVGASAMRFFEEFACITFLLIQLINLTIYFF